MLLNVSQLNVQKANTAQPKLLTKPMTVLIVLKDITQLVVKCSNAWPKNVIRASMPLKLRVPSQTSKSALTALSEHTHPAGPRPNACP